LRISICITGLLAALVLAQGAQSAEIVVGANVGNVPWEFADARGNVVGFEIDLIREIASRLGHTVEIVNIPFNGLFPAVQSGRVDVALSSITVTDKRLGSVAFAQPYYDSAQSLTVHASSDADGLGDMRGAIIGVDTGSTGDMWTTANRERYGFENIVAESPAMRRVVEQARIVVREARATTILVLGESGTGKGLLASAMHYASGRASQPFLKVTCSAIPESLLEAELFGHERGAFTDAKERRLGVFEATDAGTGCRDEDAVGQHFARRHG